ncbi:MAG: phytanoyl-CoA dioxygenase family protein [Burkholderiaceae bacterium]|nr:phytanoyl-CoA dioxygenase family protein [Burkholderiaceae bacterium]
MTPEQILAIEPRVLSQAQREFYFTEGYLLLPGVIDPDWIGRLRDATDRLVERSRGVSRSDDVFDLEPGHSSDAPRLRRVSKPVEQDPVYWAYVTESIMPDIVADLVGPDVKFHHSKLNFKWLRGGEEVKWHYDISFWPHTNYSPLTVGTYLYDCGMDQGPLAVLPRSHEIEPMLSQYGDDGQWTGCLGERDLARLDLSKAVYLTGPAGSLTLHNCRTLHSSPRNMSDQGRPLLLNTLSSADAIPYTSNPIKSRFDQAIVRGKPARFAHHDPRPCLLPPDWSGGYSSIFALQQGEEGRASTAGASAGMM